MNLLIDLFVVILGIAVLRLGIKGFSEEGLPWAYSWRLVGAGARVIGSLCILLGLLWIAYGLWAMAGGS
jgi:hypothetical protein